ncbi:flagellar hook-basal body complex protein [Marinobacterium sp. AK62]|uniref:Flagellar hook protein FlgE n=1 Tax=Marinobacterium alkalitolerans TaxID=1542925 RepID=A0ABS3ZB20_9GAMM|nr:flagellar hook-basal body complex protein [Marinobacterium alkalitolerans]MBP0048555.1 flagellar hook-basal body complex protein [Marinobacterium alkalitolerans]
MAGFNTAVTGLKASTSLLDVAGNNIANSSTVGFKSSRTEFADIYATAVVGAGSSNTPGSGVTVSDIAQDFSGGTIEFTNSNLDLAINGSGFFQLDDGQGNVTYTRAGAFELDKDGNIVSKNGKYLQGYGLDAQGNQLPVQNLSVTEKESPPKATEQVDLAFNINSNNDATQLEGVFDKNEPNSYSWSTTVGTFDSLGNENSIRFYFAEQRPVKEVYRYDISTSDFDTAGGSDPIKVSGLALSTTVPSPDGELGLTEILDGGVGTGVYILSDEEKAKLADVDPRIDVDSFRVVDNATASGGTGWDLSFEFKSEFTEYGDMAVELGTQELSSEPVDVRDANEIQSATFQASAFDATTGELLNAQNIVIGGVSIPLTTAMTRNDVGAAISAAEQDILDANPDVESISYVPLNSDGVPELQVRWKADAGNVNPLPITISDVTLSAGPPAAPESVLSNTDASNGDVTLSIDEEGDNSFLGAYRMYAFLNDTAQLDIGKLQDPGAGTQTEVGPVMVTFDPTNGVLETVNGGSVPTSGVAPKLTIFGADPANPQDNLLDNDTDSLRGIQLDITGSSQFASESIVKGQQQDGYTKGDLIGVSFAETGEMVASYSNGQRANLGLVAIATFENQDGLQPSGNTEWISTLSSGNAILNPPGTGLNGTLRSAALEQSNVDLSAELVKLIEGQRNFQANSKTLETLNTVTQAILQI